MLDDTRLSHASDPTCKRGERGGASDGVGQGGTLTLARELSGFPGGIALTLDQRILDQGREIPRCPFLGVA
jgi:hypothetical protein